MGWLIEPVGATLLIGAIIGLKLKRFGIFIEGEYTKFWDTKIYNSSIGINYML